MRKKYDGAVIFCGVPCPQRQFKHPEPNASLINFFDRISPRSFLEKKERTFIGLTRPCISYAYTQWQFWYTNTAVRVRIWNARGDRFQPLFGRSFFRFFWEGAVIFCQVPLELLQHIAFLKKWLTLLKKIFRDQISPYPRSIFFTKKKNGRLSA